MNRSVWMAGFAVLAIGCTTTLEPIGSVAGVGGAGAGAGAGGIAGFGGSAGFGGAAGVAGVGGGNSCDDGDPCTSDVTWFDETGFVRCCHYADPACGAGGGVVEPGCEAGAGGSAGYAGAAGGAGFSGTGGAGGVGADGGDLCDDFDPCTSDTNIPLIGCVHEMIIDCSVAGSGGFAGEAGAGAGGVAGSAGFGGAGSGGCGEMGFDDDADGYQNSVCGGDCDDSDANAYPWQQSFYSAARNSGGFDYDCDGQVTLRWGELHEGCSLDPAMQACVGSGWTSPDMNTAFLPGCGQSAAYAFCEFTGNDCAISMHAVTQACR